MKKCNRCNIEKSLSDFRKRSDSKDGHRNDCKSCSSLFEKKRRVDNHKFVREKEKECYERNKDVWKDSRSNYRKINKEKLSIYMKKYYIDNREELLQYSLGYSKNRKKIDVIFKSSLAIRNIIYQSITKNGFSKSSRASDILGCSFQDFKKYIESKFESWMSWDNYGKYNGELNYGWDIDHIIPSSSAKSIDEIIKLNHFTNLQPLCSYTNRYIKKDNKFYEIKA
jgi:hypothetical protein